MSTGHEQRRSSDRYWTVKVGPNGTPLPLSDARSADYYVFTRNHDQADAMIAGYLCRAESGLWRSYDVCGRPMPQDQTHLAMALADVARTREARRVTS